MFIPYSGDTMGLPENDDYMVFVWDVDFCKILFSVTQKGRAANCHFASNKKGLKFLKNAILLFCEFCFMFFDWCDVVVAMVNKKSVERLMVKCGLKKVYENKNASVWEKGALCHS